ncbi:hypothetical protein [Clostridioides sp. ZZV15-6597]|uniref:hypothetical protein n=1 Tax=Clostridioides sp. ZZV15-6597 TaxID=2811500 RepID=UPI001D106DAA|nr:hypothetical protein [Clostridioides sp. ZZV15-6597]HBF1820600.1 hypothetical protein [Clostridioides difficile]
MNGMKTYIEYIKNILEEVDEYEPPVNILNSMDVNSLYSIVKDIDMLMQISSYKVAKEDRFIKSENYLCKNILSNLEVVLMSNVDEYKKENIKKYCGFLLDEDYKINSADFKCNFGPEVESDDIYINKLPKYLVDDNLDISNNNSNQTNHIHNIDEKMASTIKILTNKFNLNKK